MAIVMFMLLIYCLGVTAWNVSNQWVIAGLKRKNEELSYDLKQKPKEIEVIRRAVCECGHESSKHDDKRGCREELFKTVDGVETSRSFVCKCMRYTGPQPLPQYYAPPLLELEEPQTMRLQIGKPVDDDWGM